MRDKWSPFCLPPRRRWMMWLLLGLGAGGIAAGVLLLEAPRAVAGEACPALAVLLGVYAIMYWFFNCVFKANPPCHRDTQNHLTKRDGT